MNDDPPIGVALAQPGINAFEQMRLSSANRAMNDERIVALARRLDDALGRRECDPVARRRRRNRQLMPAAIRPRPRGPSGRGGRGLEQACGSASRCNAVRPGTRSDSSDCGGDSESRIQPPFEFSVLAGRTDFVDSVVVVDGGLAAACSARAI